ncbi:MAG TPA: signal recognition particle-docking protein FtsY [Candidatus Fimenecus stercoravium]|nr:signal recognition particle-docking protein FtsY [Candidatus Fimenecus stercoravium]
MKRMGIFSKINFGLSKTRNKMAGAIDSLFADGGEITDDLYAELEEILVMGDVGMVTAVEITERLKKRVSEKRLRGADAVKNEIKEIVAELLEGGEDMGLVTVPSVVLVIGVNGVGKTTTIGKLAAMYKAEGKRVILGAADTFRAAAIDQLGVWAGRAGVELVKHSEGADPAAVVFDTVNAAKARDCDIVIIDTAGRLHNKKNLMDELAKIYRVIDRELPYSDREVLLVLDATTGQNAVNQAREFMNVAEITGIVLTKLDGTARGGVVLAIKNELGIPVKFVGVGEQMDDLQPFDPHAFAEGLFEQKTYDEEESTHAQVEKDDVEARISDVSGVRHPAAARPEPENEPAGAAPDAAASETGRAASGTQADESGISELDTAADEVTETQAPEKPKKEKRRFGFFNRHT